MQNYQQILGYQFRDVSLLDNALTHSSYSNERRCKSNERLEFLGDSVLSIIISDYIYHRMPQVSEGVLTKMRASLVCEQSLAEVAKKIALADHVKLGRGEEFMGGRRRASIVSDAFEAVLASIYLDGGMEAARKWLLPLMQESLDRAEHGQLYKDYKTMLQEAVQKGDTGKVTYQVVGESGPDHRKHFEVEVLIDYMPVSRGDGTSKKEAEQNAAHAALDKIEKER